MAAARLIEMGTEPFLVASGVECVIAQRLARRLCECKQPAAIAPEVLAANGFAHAGEPVAAFEPAGCVRCNRSGYRGRVGLFEVMVIGEEIRSLILEKADGDTVRAVAGREGMRSLRETGLDKIRAGVTDLPEVLRVLGSEIG